MSDPALNPQPAYHGHLAFTGMGEPADQAGVMIEPRDDLAMAIVMPRKGQGAALAALVRQTCGVDLPAGPKRIAAGPLAFVGMGPGQFLAVEQGGDALTFASRLSSIALIGAHLWQLDDAPTYEISVFRSMAGSFADFLWSSAAEYGVSLKG